MKLHFKRITPFDKALLAFNKNLLSKNIQYNFERFILYKSSIAANQSQLFLSQPFGNLIPNKLYILMTRQSASIGDPKKNAQYFDNFKLDDLKIIANGLSVIDYEVGFPNKYSVLYKRVTDTINSKRNSISYSKFAYGASIISVDCQNNDNDNDSLFQIEKQGHLEINMRFSEALAETINIHIIGRTLGSLEIDYERRVSVHYNFKKNVYSCQLSKKITLMSMES